MRDGGDMHQQNLNIEHDEMDGGSKCANMRGNGCKLSRKASHLPSVNGPVSK